MSAVSAGDKTTTCGDLGAFINQIGARARQGNHDRSGAKLITHADRMEAGLGC